MAISLILREATINPTLTKQRVALGMDLIIGVALLTIGLLGNIHLGNAQHALIPMSNQLSAGLIGAGSVYLGISLLPFFMKMYRVCGSEFSGSIWLAHIHHDGRRSL